MSIPRRIKRQCRERYGLDFLEILRRTLCNCWRIIPEACAWRPNETLMVSVSGKPVVRTHTVRIPDGASSIERFLDKASTKGAAIRAGSGVWKRITPDLLRIMNLAAALAVMKCDLV